MAVERVREGESPSDVIAGYRMNRTTIHKWLVRAKGKGAGLRKLRASKGTGRPRKLDAKQEGQVFQALVRVPLSVRLLEMEADRAPLVQPYQHELGGRDATDVRDHDEIHRRDCHAHRATGQGNPQAWWQ